MDLATEQKVINMLEILCETYDKAPGKNQAKVYLRTLKDVDNEHLETAVFDHIAASKFFPRVSELRAAALRVRQNSGRSTEYERMDEPRTIFWRGMSAFSACLRQEISADQLEAERAWKWCEKHAYLGQRSEPANVQLLLDAEVESV
jgi:hypothetical protein